MSLNYILQPGEAVDIPAGTTDTLRVSNPHGGQAAQYTYSSGDIVDARDLGPGIAETFDLPNAAVVITNSGNVSIEIEGW